MATNTRLEPDSSGQAEPPQPEERNWRALVSGQSPAFNWAVAAVVGAISISVTRQDTAVRFLLPITVMIIYVWISYPRDVGAGLGLRMARIAQLADSAYFLGFLWTLWALIDSFVLRHATGAETAFRVFGYALVTTALGMAIRLSLIQFKYGAADQESEADFRVERSLEKFSTTMQDASRSTQTFQKAAAALNQSIEDLSSSLETLDEKFENTHRDTIKTIAENIKSVVEEVRGALKAPVQEYGRAVRAFTANVDQHSELLSQSFQQWATKLHEDITAISTNTHKILKDTEEQLAADHRLVATQLKDEAARVVEELQQLSQKLASIDLPVDGLQKMSQGLSELEASLVVLGAMLGPTGQVTINLVDFAERVKSGSAGVTEALTDLSNKLNTVAVPREVIVSISDVIRSMEDLRLATEALLQRANDQRWQKAPQIASDAISKLTASVNNLRESLDSAAASASYQPPKKSFWSWR